MARKIERPIGPEELKAQAAAQAAAAEAQDLETLHPERAIEIAGRVVRIREFGYIEGTHLQAGMAGFISELYAEFTREGAAPSFDSIEALIARHITLIHWVVANAITPHDDEDPDAFIAAVKANAGWIGGLSDIEGDRLVMAWWGVNKGFFIRRLQRRAAVEAKAAAGSASPRSTTP